MSGLMLQIRGLEKLETHLCAIGATSLATPSHGDLRGC
jgi:hypothetical protein